jgi:hypothetical protein
MQANIYLPLLMVFVVAACSGSGKKEGSEKIKGGRVLKETLATGDTGFINLTRFRKKDIRENLCQQWELSKLEGASSSELVLDENFDAIRPQYNFFKDGSVLENPRKRLRLGKWQLRGSDSLLLFFADSLQRWFIITTIDSRQLRMVTKNESGKALFLNLEANGIIHSNMYNDPFHPANNQWRVRSEKPESDSAIRQRVTNCLKFFALYYRDNLLRNKSSIDFEGFPKIFRWYRGGIGLPDRDKIDSTWTNCFYNEDEAMKGYKFLRMLIVDYEYQWPEKVPWYLQTHSVLEQMYHRASRM